ncbi:MAG: nitrous oxide reductase accessory protein NosL, partial [Bradymonadaceae bacterium]
MKLAVLVLTVLLGFTAVACQKDSTTSAAGPETGQPLEIDTHECSACGMVVREQPAPRGQAIHRDGTREFFCSIADLVHYSRTPSPHGSITHVFLETLDPAVDPMIPDASARPWTTPEQAKFVVDVARPGVMGKPVLVYDARADVGVVTAEHGGRAVTWEEVEAHVLGPVSAAA